MTVVYFNLRIFLLFCKFSYDLYVHLNTQVSTNPSAVGGCSCKSSFMVKQLQRYQLQDRKQHFVAKYTFQILGVLRFLVVLKMFHYGFLLLLEISQTAWSYLYGSTLMTNLCICNHLTFYGIFVLLYNKMLNKMNSHLFLY